MVRNKLLLWVVLLVVVVLLGILVWQVIGTSSKNTPPAATSEATLGITTNLGTKTKETGCLAQGALQDTACTPGAIIPGVTSSQVCVSGYSTSIRNVNQNSKNQVYLEYGITSHKTGEYEVDHLISLELGGSNDIANLWPEPAEPRPGFHEKDKVENYLHDQVCKARLRLQKAQQLLARNWLQVYQCLPSCNFK